MEILYIPTLLHPPKGIYEPQEDTFLLIEAIKEEDVKNKKVLEIGTGNGVVAYSLSFLAHKVWANDINKKAISFVSKEIKKDNIYFFIGNLLEGINILKVDTIIFNPPYLPPSDKEIGDEIERRALEEETCNKSVIKIIDLLEKINKKIVFYFIASSLCKNSNILPSYINNKGMTYKIIKRKRFFFEEICVYRVST